MTHATCYRRRDVLRVSGLLVGASLIGLNRAYAQASPSPITVVNSAGGLGGIMQTMVKQLGYEKDFGLDIDYVNVGDGAKISAGLISGSGDMCAWSGFSQVLPAIEKGAPLKILGGCLTSPTLGLFSHKPEVRKITDLVGRTVAAGAPGSLLYMGSVAAMRKAGMDEKTVHFVNIGSSTDTLKATMVGTVDAGVAEVEILDQAPHYGIHLLEGADFWNQLPQFTWQAAYTTTERIQNKRELLVRMMALDARLYRFICSPGSWDAWDRAHRAYYGKDEDPIRSKTFWNFIQKRQNLSKDIVISPESIKYVQDLNLSLGIQKQALTYEQLTDMSLAHDALKLLA